MVKIDLFGEPYAFVMNNFKLENCWKNFEFDEIALNGSKCYPIGLKL